MLTAIIYYMDPPPADSEALSSFGSLAIVLAILLLLDLQASCVDQLAKLLEPAPRHTQAQLASSGYPYI